VADSQLQHLRRAWEASGSPEDEAAYLTERRRAGELSDARLRAAADFGSQAATLALGRTGGVSSLFDGLIALSPRERIALACDCAERTLHLWSSERPGDLRPQALLRSARRWVAGRVDEDRIHTQAEEVWGSCVQPHEVDPATRVARLTYWAGNAILAEGEGQAETCAEVLEQAVRALAEAAWEEAYANGELVADLKQEHTANVERSWQRSRLCRYLLHPPREDSSAPTGPAAGP